MNSPTLFSHPGDAAEEIDQQIVALLTGQSGGPFGLHLGDDERLVLKAIRHHRGLDRAVTIARIRQSIMESGNGVRTDREIKQAVRTLRVAFHLPIGSSKHGSDGGYFVIVTAEDMAAFVKGPLDQMRAEAEVLKAVAGPRRTRELLGQLQMEVAPTEEGTL